MEVELLNPYSEKMTLDDKVSILDIKARDDQGRLYNLEMQMLATAALVQRRFSLVQGLFAAAVRRRRLHPSAADDFDLLRERGVVWGPTGAPHTVPTAGCDGPGVPDGRLGGPRDRAAEVHADAGGTAHATGLLAVLSQEWRRVGCGCVAGRAESAGSAESDGVLKMLAQSDVERELYEGRLKAKRDMQTLETLRDQWQQRYEAANREREAANRREEQAHREVRRQSAERICLCQRLLRRSASRIDELVGWNVEELQEQVERLEREVTEKTGPA